MREEAELYGRGKQVVDGSMLDGRAGGREVEKRKCKTECGRRVQRRSVEIATVRSRVGRAIDGE